MDDKGYNGGGSLKWSTCRPDAAEATNVPEAGTIERGRRRVEGHRDEDYK